MARSTMPQLDYTRKAVRYFRISGKSQKENFSLRNQDARSANYCERKGLPLDRDFDDVATGLSIKRRPGFVEMAEYVLDKRNGVTDLVVNDIDRFARNYREYLDYLDRITAAGIIFHSVIDDEEYDYNSEEKWTDRAVSGQKESKRISRRTKEGQRTATELGYHIGPVPWGYMLKHETEELDESGYHTICGKLIPNPEIWHHVLEFWSMAVDGTTPMPLTRHLHLTGVPSPRGNPWTANTVLGIMKNPKYYGLLFWGEHPQSRIPGPKEKDPPKIYRENNHEAAVSRENWKKVNDGIKSRHRSRGPTRSDSSPNPLSNLLKCADCAAQGVDSNLVLATKNGVPYLRCARRKKGATDDCKFKGARLDEVLETVADRLRNHFLTEDTLDRIIEGVAEISRGFLQEKLNERSCISDQKKKVIAEIKNINDVLKQAGDQAPNLTTLLKDLAKLEREREALEKADSQITQDSEEALLFVNDKNGIIETALSLKTFTDPADPDAVRELMKIFIKKVAIFPREPGAKKQRGIIDYDLPARQAGPPDVPDTETVYFEKRKTPADPKSCVFDASTGVILE